MIGRLATVTAFVAGIFMVAQYFIKTPFTESLYRTLLDYYQILFAVTMVVGSVALFRHHTRLAGDRHRGGVYSVVTIAAISFMVIAALLFGTGTQSPYQWAFNNLQAPMQATTFSLLAFFVASAAYRGFRVRSRPALVLALAAVLILVGKSVFADLLGELLPQTAGWILNVPSAAAKRGILIGVGLGSIATALASSSE